MLTCEKAKRIAEIINKKFGEKYGILISYEDVRLNHRVFMADQSRSEAYAFQFEKVTIVVFVYKDGSINAKILEW